MRVVLHVERVLVDGAAGADAAELAALLPGAIAAAVRDAVAGPDGGRHRTGSGGRHQDGRGGRDRDGRGGRDRAAPGREGPVAGTAAAVGDAVAAAVRGAR